MKINKKAKKIIASGMIVLTAGIGLGCEKNEPKENLSSIKTTTVEDTFKEYYELYDKGDSLDSLRFEENHYTVMNDHIDQNLTEEQMMYLDQQLLKEYLYQKEQTSENVYYIQNILSGMVEGIVYPNLGSSYRLEQLSFKQQLAIIEMIGQSFSMLEKSEYADDINYLRFGHRFMGIGDFNIKLEQRYGKAYINARNGDDSELSQSRAYTFTHK